MRKVPRTCHACSLLSFDDCCLVLSPSRRAASQWTNMTRGLVEETSPTITSPSQCSSVCLSESASSIDRYLLSLRSYRAASQSRIVVTRPFISNSQLQYDIFHHHSCSSSDVYKTQFNSLPDWFTCYVSGMRRLCQICLGSLIVYHTLRHGHTTYPKDRGQLTAVPQASMSVLYHLAAQRRMHIESLYLLSGLLGLKDYIKRPIERLRDPLLARASSETYAKSTNLHRSVFFRGSTIPRFRIPTTSYQASFLSTLCCHSLVQRGTHSRRFIACQTKALTRVHMGFRDLILTELRMESDGCSPKTLLNAIVRSPGVSLKPRASLQPMRTGGLTWCPTCMPATC